MEARASGRLSGTRVSPRVCSIFPYGGAQNVLRDKGLDDQHRFFKLFHSDTFDESSVLLSGAYPYNSNKNILLQDFLKDFQQEPAYSDTCAKKLFSCRNICGIIQGKRSDFPVQGSGSLKTPSGEQHRHTGNCRRHYRQLDGANG